MIRPKKFYTIVDKETKTSLEYRFPGGIIAHLSFAKKKHVEDFISKLMDSDKWEIYEFDPNPSYD